MKHAAMLAMAGLSIAVGAMRLPAQQAPNLANHKAQKTYESGLEWLGRREYFSAMAAFKKADKQDGGQCEACRQQIIKLGLQTGDFKSADDAAREAISEAPASNAAAVALAHDARGNVLLREAIVKNKSELYSGADEEYKSALKTYQNFPDALFADGMALGHLKRDGEATAQFEHYVALSKSDRDHNLDSIDLARAERYIAHPELVRARMAPAFAVTTLRGQHISLDGLQGKVVLIDFWATWCGPCREALPHMQEIAKKFQGQPLVILSVSLDNDESAWKDFVEKNRMTWFQYRDGYFDGHLARLFQVHEIPQTFTIDTNGVLEDQHVGDASIEGKLRKLCAQARAADEASTSVAKATQ